MTNQQIRVILHRYSHMNRPGHYSDTEFDCLQDVFAFVRDVVEQMRPTARAAGGLPPLPEPNADGLYTAGQLTAFALDALARVPAPETKLSANERTTVYHQGYLAGVEHIAALAADSASPPRETARQIQQRRKLGVLGNVAAGRDLFHGLPTSKANETKTLGHLRAVGLLDRAHRITDAGRDFLNTYGPKT